VGAQVPGAFNQRQRPSHLAWFYQARRCC